MNDDSPNTESRSAALFLVLSGFFGFTAVLAGAFGSHALAASFTPRQMEIWEIGNLYHLVHAVALFGVALLAARPGRLVLAAGSFFTLGMLLFVGSLYTIALTGFRSLGMLAPVGGLSLMIGWASLMAVGISFLRSR